MAGWVSNNNGTSSFETKYGILTLPDEQLDNSWFGDDIADITTESEGYHS